MYYETKYIEQLWSSGSVLSHDKIVDLALIISNCDEIENRHLRCNIADCGYDKLITILFSPKNTFKQTIIGAAIKAQQHLLKIFNIPNTTYSKGDEYTDKSLNFLLSLIKTYSERIERKIDIPDNLNNTTDDYIVLNGDELSFLKSDVGEIILDIVREFPCTMSKLDDFNIMDFKSNNEYMNIGDSCLLNPDHYDNEKDYEHAIKKYLRIANR